MLQHQGGRSWQPFGPRNTVFDPQKVFFFPKDFQKVRKSRQNNICYGLTFSSESKLFSEGRRHDATPPIARLEIAFFINRCKAIDESKKAFYTWFWLWNSGAGS